MKRFSIALMLTLCGWALSGTGQAHGAPAFMTSTQRLASGPTGAREYVVKAGDTLLGIALEFDVSMAAIQLLNDVPDPRLIRAGQALRIPAGKIQPDENAFWVLHVVQAGETLGAIATQHSVNLSDLTRVNDIADPSSIRVGQKLIVPVSGLATQVSASPPKKQANAQPVPTPTAELIPLVPINPPAEAIAAAPEPVATPAATPVPLPANAVSDAASDGNVDAIRSRLLELYNQARATGGLPPLQLSLNLQESAQSHAEDCAARGKGSHVGSDGSRSSQRIARAGYAGRITGENWVWARTADRAFEMWYTQEIPDGPHLLNIMSPHYVEVGYGIAASKGGFYMIANFGAP
jgi:uncharacterized protein YkwD